MKRLAIIAVLLVSAFSLVAQKAVLTGRTMPLEKLASRSEAHSLGGWDFMKMCDTIGFWPREQLILSMVLAGNVPDSLRTLHEIKFTTSIVDSVPILREPHEMCVWVACDYLSIGTDDDAVRMPMGPVAAQEICDSLYCTLPTPFLVDRINDVAQGALEIFPFRPVGDRNTYPYVFQDSNNAINALMQAKGYHWGMFVSGLKKDVVLSSRLNECRDRVVIYGWHHPDGSVTQPCYAGHVNYYVDYSHGIRLVSRHCTVDGHPMDIRTILEDSKLYRLLSDESQPIIPATYPLQ